MTQIWVAVITAVVAPCVLLILQRFLDRPKDMHMRIRRMEIIMNLYHNPEDKKTILDLYDEYRKEGGNSYIQNRVEHWQRSKKNGNH